MNFQSFLVALAELKSKGWNVRIREVPCTAGTSSHLHLALQLKPPPRYKRRPWLDPVLAVATAKARGNVERIGYSDPSISLHGISVAAGTLDWLEQGRPQYAEARLQMMQRLGISQEKIKELAPSPRTV